MSMGFVFNIDKCVGCQACSVACYLANNQQNNILWRNVFFYNSLKLPELPIFSFSLACNNCSESPCLKNCPAKAYSKDKNSGIVVHHPEKCIGCKYCTWACPFDVPKFNPGTKIIEKCNLCFERITNKKKPACVEACPLNALEFDFNLKKNVEQDVNGFPQSDAQPNIQFTGYDKLNKIEIAVPNKTNNNIQEFFLKQIEPKSKTSFLSEFPLWMFSTILTFMVSLFSAFTVMNGELNPFAFSGLGFLAITFSSFHLGKKKRAYRAVFNFKSSWLSREIILLCFFIIMGAISLMIIPVNRWFAWLTVAVGFILLFVVDKIYIVSRKRIDMDVHSANTFLTGLLLTSLFAENYSILVFLTVVKAVLYIYRKYSFYRKHLKYRLFLSAWRLDLLITFPVLFALINPSNLFWYVTISFIIGELIDRFEFYDEMQIITPQVKIYEDMEKDLDK